MTARLPPLRCVWEWSTGPQGPYGGCTLSVYDSDDDPDGLCAIYRTHVARPFAQLTAGDRARFEARGIAAARVLLRDALNPPTTTETTP